MKYILYTAIALLTTLSACKPEETSEPIAWLCPSLNNEQYLHYEGNDSAKCWVPNVFSPNADGSNDVYRIGAYNIAQLKFKISSNGSTIYESDSSDAIWDGTISGETAVQGVYDCKLSGTDIWGHSFVLYGEISILSNVDFITSPTAYINCDTCRFASQYYDNGIYDPTLHTNEFWANVVCE